MTDSTDMFGEPESQPGQPRPSAAELEAAGQSALFGAAPAPASPPAPGAAPLPADPVADSSATGPAASAAQPYRVLARKYRPQTFSALIGQDAMVQTLANAIQRGRLAHAFLMTGVRGVGKTSTARLIAKALNCVGPDGQGGPTIDPCGVCEPCRAIADGRHIDVIEMDAASHTGVDDVREIIEAVRYAAVSARYKVYIIDEVHMLSRNAFNALLKTLEEPPPGVKFLFATTEIEKLPVTVLSRCQRFDLRRIPADLLQEHFAAICAQEGVKAEPEALAMIAQAAEGSVRDGLSILDQAIAHADLGAGAGEGEGGGEAGDGQPLVLAAQVREMLGLADRGAVLRLFGHLLEGDPQALLAATAQLHSLGVEPQALLRGLLAIAHRLAVTQIAGGEADTPVEAERVALCAWARRLGAGQVHRLWQLLLRGHEEVRTAPDPQLAAEMALLRVLHAAELPDPGQLARLVEGLAAGVAAPAPGPEAAAHPAPAAALDWAALCEAVEQAGMLRVAQTMRDWVRVVELAPGRLAYQLAPGFSADPAADLREALKRATGTAWQVQPGEGPAAPSLRELAEAEARAADEKLRAHPLVKAALAAFPAAEFIEEEQPVRGRPGWSRRA